MRKAYRGAILILATLLLCVLSNIAAFGIDTEQMRVNAKSSAWTLGQDGAGPELLGGFQTASIGNYTDVMMIKTAAYVGPEPLIQKAFGGYRTDLQAAEGEDVWMTYCTYDDSDGQSGGYSYARYWHGYILPLRLALSAMNVSNIRMVLYFMQMALSTTMIMLLCQRGLKRLIPAWLMAYFLMMPATMSVSLHYAPNMLVMFLASLLVLRWDGAIDRWIGFPVFFAWIGMLTNYFDLMTYPLVTLGYPLVLLAALRLREQPQASAVCLFKQMFIWCVAWAIGYAGMWMLKWGIVFAMFGLDILLNIIRHIFLRVSTDSDGRTFTRLSVVARNLNIMTSKSSYLLITGLTTLFVLVKGLFGYLRAKRTDWRALVLLLPAAMPFAWCLLMSNHSYDHPFFTYRIFTITVLAMLALVPYLWPGKDAREADERK